MKKIYLILSGLILLVILFLIMLLLLGYKFNKNFINFNQQECTENKRVNIEGCVFWMRHNYLEKTQSWPTLFKQDSNYCLLKHKNNSSLDYLNDPKCDYVGFQNKKRNENWAYLVSKEKDGFYNYCVNQFCPKQTIFN